jgi:hypothetical protein
MAGSLGVYATISEDTTHPPFAAIDAADRIAHYMEIE